MADSNTDNILCSLCGNKKFKNSRALKIHQRRVHYSKRTIHVSSSEFFSCPLYPNTKYKKKVDGVYLI